MIVITDTTLKAAGLTFGEARGILAPDPETLVVHVSQVLDDAPPVPQATAVEPQQPAASPAKTSRVTRPATDQQSDVYTLQPEHLKSIGNPDTAIAVRARMLSDKGLSERSTKSPFAKWLRDNAIDDSAADEFDGKPRINPAPAERSQRPSKALPGPSNVLGIPKLPDRGLTLAQVQAVAHALGAALVPSTDGQTFQIVSTFAGASDFADLSTTADRLNRRSIT